MAEVGGGGARGRLCACYLCVPAINGKVFVSYAAGLYSRDLYMCVTQDLSSCVEVGGLVL